MKLFECQSCGQLLYFENSTCLRCGNRLGYLPDLQVLSALSPAGNDRWQSGLRHLDPILVRHLFEGQRGLGVG